MKLKPDKIIKEVKSWGTIIVIALLLKVTIIEAYIVPTGSMENTIMTGDFLIGNRFVYGMRTPDWIGIPYTDKGFNVPYIRLPKFKEPTPGEVIIFKYPRDVFHKYVNRCVAGPGDTLEIINRELFINGESTPLSKNGKFLGPLLDQNFIQQDLFLPGQGNKDFFSKIRIPQAGDTVRINNETDWRYWLPIILYDGHSAALINDVVEYEFTTIDPDNLFRRKGEHFVYDDYFPSGKLLNPWMNSINKSDFRFLHIDGKPISEMDYYVVEQNYYWAMGDNRDDSLDSRYWGFIPENYILGEALFVYFSLNLKTWIPRFSRIFTVIK
jgi:signal peptidase I